MLNYFIAITAAHRYSLNVSCLSGFSATISKVYRVGWFGSRGGGGSNSGNKVKKDAFLSLSKNELGLLLLRM